MTNLCPDFEVEITTCPWTVLHPHSVEVRSQIDQPITLVRAYANFRYGRGWVSTISHMDTPFPSVRQSAENSAFTLLAAVIAAYDWPSDEGLSASNKEWFSLKRLKAALVLLQSHELQVVIRCGGIVRPISVVASDIACRIANLQSGAGDN